ncbi:MAG: maturase [Candidatus Omnitrophica bacterium]|nr:maturase [Candidatus Omnitrophota bacterium]
MRVITSRNGGRSLEQVSKELKGYLTGWKEYFRLAETPRVFLQLDEWIGHRLRMIHLKQWKRGSTIFRELVAAGVSRNAAASVAACSRSWWKMSGTSAVNVALPTAYFTRLGVPRLSVK